MSKELADFQKITLEILREEGPANCRKSWVKLKKQAKQLNHARDYLGKASPEFLALLCLAKTEEFSKIRQENLQKIFGETLNSHPGDSFLQALRLFPFKDLELTLLPFVYDSGNIGKVACYLAAKLSIFAAPEAFPFFLKVRKWTNSEMMNLAHLVRKNEVFSVLEKLEKASKTANSGVSPELFDEFRYILLNLQNHDPIFPDLHKETNSLKPATSNPEEKSEKKPDELPKTNSTQKTLAELQNKLDNISFLGKPLAALLIGLLALYFSLSMPDNPEITEVKVVRPNRRQKSPEAWIDASTQTIVTEKYLAADKDYRMGELYLTRDKFHEAISLFEDALAQDPKHLMARLRLGYSKMMVGKRDEAGKILTDLVNSAPETRLANLYLAQLAVSRQDYNQAEKFYLAEVERNKDLSVGLEFAGFLQQIGETGKAERVLDEFRELYPDRTLIVTKPGSAGEK